MSKILIKNITEKTKTPFTSLSILLPRCNHNFYIDTLVFCAFTPIYAPTENTSYDYVG